MFTMDKLSGLTAKRLRELLSYDQETGHFRWRVRVNPSGYNHAGKVAGCLNKNTGHWLIRIGGRLYLAHRLAWLYVTGAWPPDEIDHKDNIGCHNNWSNLRLASSTQNKMNMRLRCDNSTGFKGVSQPINGYRREKTYRARIQINGRQLYLGRFATAKEAHDAYITKARELFGEFANKGD